MDYNLNMKELHQDNKNVRIIPFQEAIVVMMVIMEMMEFVQEISQLK
jgi:hypothetical protein